MKKFVLVLSFLLFPIFGYSQISALSGSIINGSTLSIYGTNFGTKPTGTFRFETFEEALPSNITITNVSIASKFRHVNSLYAGFGDIGTAGPTTKCQLERPTYGSPAQNIVATTWYVDYWFRMEEWDWGLTADDDMNGLSKVLRFNSGAGTPDNVNFITRTYTTHDEYVISSEHITPAWEESGEFSVMDMLTENAWHHLQTEYKECTTVGGNDGIWRIWIDGELIINETALETYDGDDNDDWSKPLTYLGWWGGSAGVENRTLHDYFYMDDVAYDTTWARVEIGDSNSYNNCTHRELQKPVSWSSTHIETLIDIGTFKLGTTAYLFVVKSDGTVLDSFPITINETYYVGNPVVQSLAGTYSKNEVVTINGYGFDTKNPAPPMTWVNFDEFGPDEAVMDADSTSHRCFTYGVAYGYNSWNTKLTVYDSDSTPDGDGFCVLGQYPNPYVLSDTPNSSNYDNCFWTIFPQSAVISFGDNVYVSFTWWHNYPGTIMDDCGSNQTQWKMHRLSHLNFLTECGNENEPEYRFGWNDFDQETDVGYSNSSISLRNIEHYPDMPSYWQVPGGGVASPPAEKWINQEWRVVVNSDYTAFDGWVDDWVDGGHAGNTGLSWAIHPADWEDCNHYPHQKIFRGIRFGKQMQGVSYCDADGVAPWDPTYTFRIDNIYADTTFARVILGDNPIYENCTKRNPQPPITWSPTEITITLSPGNLDIEETVFLFVLTSSEEVSNGYPVDFGTSSGDPELPGPPGKPTLQKDGFKLTVSFTNSSPVPDHYNVKLSQNDIWKTIQTDDDTTCVVDLDLETTFVSCYVEAVDSSNSVLFISPRAYSGW